MSIYYYAIKSNGDYIFDNFPKGLVYLLGTSSEGNKVISVRIDSHEIHARIGRKNNSYGSIYVLTTEEKYINRYKLFKELLELSLIAIEPLSRFQNELIERHNSINQEFIHNLTSLSTHSIQALFALVPQSSLTGNIHKQNETVKKILEEQPNVASKTILKLIKYSLSTKIEFSVFERTMKLTQVAQKIVSSIREVILSILQIFIEDFEEKKITVYLDACEKQINLDHDSFFVSLYYIFDNSIKYCCPNTDYKIIFKEEDDSFSVLFIMISVRIDDAEVEKLYVKGYRSENVKQLNSSGNGIGMYRILKTLNFNDARLEITPRINNYNRKIGEIRYEANQFKIKFMGQQDWFKTVSGK